MKSRYIIGFFPVVNNLLKLIHFWNSVLHFMNTRSFSWCQVRLSWKGLVKDLVFIKWRLRKHCFKNEWILKSDFINTFESWILYALAKHCNCLLIIITSNCYTYKWCIELSDNEFCLKVTCFGKVEVVHSFFCQRKLKPVCLFWGVRLHKW